MSSEQHDSAAASEPFAADSMEASLTTSDVMKSLAWYREVMGFTLDRLHERDGRVFAASMRAGSVRLLVTQDDGSRGLDRKKGEGMSLQFTTTQDIDALAARAKRGGAVLDTEPMDAHGVRVFRLRDPDGFRLVISSKRAP